MSRDVTLARLLARIERRRARIVVMGQGYVGLPLAVEFAEAGFEVTGLDSNLDRVGAANQGASYIGDVPSSRLRALLERRRYSATADPSALSECDAVIICVPTPLRKSKDPDISFVVAAAEAVAARLHEGQLVVLESTTYPGTTEELLLPAFEATGLRVGRDFALAFSPERIDPGNRQFRVRDIPKVVGGVTTRCSELAAALYSQIVDRVVRVSGPKVAELAKLYENLFRNVNIALVNELAQICHRFGVETREVIEAAATKPFGFMPFYPGPGIGGHCIGVDPIYLAWKLRMSGSDSRFIQLADEINRTMPTRTVELVSTALNRQRKCLNGARVLILGVAYKRDVSDTRESPALEVIAQLRAGGAEVSYADPHVASVEVDGDPLKAIALTDAAVTEADCVLVLTDHTTVDYARVVERARLLVDTRGATWGITAPDDRIVRL